MREVRIVGFYTRNTPYELESKEMIASMEKYNLLYHLYPIDNQGQWELNCANKPSILRKALDDFPNDDLMYLDVDARVMRQPPFNEIDRGVPGICQWNPRWHPNEVLSGTIYLPNNDISRKLLDIWIAEQKAHPTDWDQRTLERIYDKVPHSLLHHDWINIDKNKKLTFIETPNVIINHTQASRRHKKKLTQLTDDKVGEQLKQFNSFSDNAVVTVVDDKSVGGINTLYKSYKLHNNNDDFYVVIPDNITVNINPDIRILRSSKVNILNIPKLFKGSSYNKVLYLDPSSVILDNLLPLLRIQMKNRPVAATTPNTPGDLDTVEQFMSAQLSNPNKHSGVKNKLAIQSDVVLYDLEIWHKLNLDDRVSMIVNSNIDFKYGNQSILGYVLSGNIIVLPHTWNCANHWISQSDDKNIPIIDKKSLKIIRYTGNRGLRPWNDKLLHSDIWQSYSDGKPVNMEYYSISNVRKKKDDSRRRRQKTRASKKTVTNMSKLYTTYYGKLKANSIFGMVGRCGGGYNTIWQDWSPEGRVARENVMREYEEELNKICGHYAKLEESVLAEGFRNPIIITVGLPRRRQLDYLPPEMREKNPRELLLMEGVTGGSRLHVAQKHDLVVPCIINDFTGRFNNDPNVVKLTNIGHVKKFYKDEPKDIGFYRREGFLEGFDPLKVGSHLGDTWAEDKLRVVRLPMWIQTMNKYGYYVDNLDSGSLQILEDAGYEQPMELLSKVMNPELGLGSRYGSASMNQDVMSKKAALRQRRDELMRNKK